MTKKPKQKTPDKIAGLGVVADVLSRIEKYQARTEHVRVAPVILAKLVREAADIDTISEVRGSLSRWESLMVRPCPVTPRHGFVPSRVIGTPEEFEAVVREVQGTEPSAWIMVNPYIVSSYSAVLTRSGIAIGESHDGVTAGKRAVTLPMKLSMPQELASRCLEVVVDQHDGLPIIVQAKKIAQDVDQESIRDDYIPENLVVTEVIDAAGYSDLEWEEITASGWWWPARKEADIAYRPVAYLPNASLLCHKALWCITRGVPLVVTHRPEVGERLSATHSAGCALSTEEYDLALHYGMNEVFKDNVSVSQVALATAHAIHHYDALVRRKDGKLFVVSALGAFAKLLIAACIAEARHAVRYWDSRGVPGISELLAATILWTDSGKAVREELCRSLVMTPGLIPIIRRTRDMFTKFDWSIDSYGGGRWGDIACELETLVNELLCKRDLAWAVSKANTLLHKMHNSSFVMDKYLGSRVDHLLGAVSNGAWDVAIEALPGIAALSAFMFSEDYVNRTPPTGDLLSVRNSALEGYHEHGVGTVIAGQEIIVRSGRVGRDLVGYLCSKFSKVIESTNVRVSRTFFDLSGQEVGRLVYPLPSNVGECSPGSAVWEAVRLDLDAPAVYDTGGSIGIIVADQWHSIGVTTWHMAAFHLYEVDNVNLILGEATQFVPSAHPAGTLCAQALTDAVKFGFGLNFNAIEASVVYAMALELAGRSVCCGSTWIYGVALGMALRYVFSVALWAESAYREENPLKGVLEIEVGPPGIGLVPRDGLFDAVVHYKFDLDFLRDVLSRPICGLWWEDGRIDDGITGMAKLLDRYRQHGIIDEKALGLAASGFHRMDRPQLLAKRWVWHPDTGAVCGLTVPRTERLHVSDMIYGLAVLRKAILGR